METAGVEPTAPRCKRGALPIELHPQVRTGGVEPPQPWATGLQPAELTSAQRPQDRGRTSGFEPEPRGSRPRMLPLHHDHHVKRGRPDSNRRVLA
jgi:hypothetical protein